MKRARLIYNPTSGREEMRKRLPDVLACLEKAGYETSSHATEGEGDATEAARQAVERGFDAIIAAGGDGTLYEVINGVAEQEYRPPIGLLPVGTTNDFARALHIPRTMNEACGIITTGHTRQIDVGKMNDRYFINIAAGGSLTELTYEVPSKLKTLVGQLAYYMKGLEKLPGLKPISLKLTSGDREIEEQVMMFLVSNSNSVGGFERLAPMADLSDGLFDVLIIRKMSIPEFIRLATLALKGDHLADEHVIHFKASELQITTSETVQMNLDGELGGRSPCHFKVLPRHLTFFCPRV